MATELIGRIESLEAGSQTIKYRFGKRSAFNKVVACTVEGERADGVMRNTVPIGSACGLMIDKISLVEAGAMIPAPAPGVPSYVTTDDEGRAIPAAAGDEINGQALSGAAAAGEMIRCLVNERPGGDVAT